MYIYILQCLKFIPINIKKTEDKKGWTLPATHHPPPTEKTAQRGWTPGRLLYSFIPNWTNIRSNLNTLIEKKTFEFDYQNKLVKVQSD